VTWRHVTAILYSRLSTSVRSLPIIQQYIYTYYHSHPCWHPLSYNYYPYAYEAKRVCTCPYTTSVSYTTDQYPMFNLTNVPVAGVVGKCLQPLKSHAFEWVRDLVGLITALHHSLDNAAKPSLERIRHHYPDRHLTNHAPIIISSLSFSSLLFLSTRQSTISLQLLPPYTP